MEHTSSASSLTITGGAIQKVLLNFEPKQGQFANDVKRLEKHCKTSIKTTLDSVGVPSCDS